MSRLTSYTIEFTDSPNPDREGNNIDLSPFVISDFTHHMMGEIAGRRQMRRRPRRRHPIPLPGQLSLLPEFNSDNDPLHRLLNIAMGEGPPTAPRANRGTKTKIPTFKCEGDLGDCSICMNRMKKNDLICRLPCSDTVSHAFHKDCITPWFESNNTCPNCRSEI